MQVVLRHKQKLSSIITICMVVVVVLVCVRLGFWQLERGEKKQQQLTAIAQIQTHGVMNWSQLLELPKQWNKTGVLVELKGTFLSEHYWLLDNQVYNGQVGYDLLALLKPNNDTRAVLVNLGWVRAPVSRDFLPKVVLPQGEFTVKAQIKENNLSSFTLEDKTASGDLPKRIQSIDLSFIKSQTNIPLVNFMAYRQGEGDEMAIPHYKAVVMSPQKHNAYALQWFLIAFACVVVAIFASKKRKKNEK
ncbi:MULTISPECIES: SURF1 family protein [unclassified Pseudoalteromonas]|uniref:SURF1 family protein n=1 Tax=unclassified Pseudoalteromonas TaxID=194690 RepID=UPI001107F015|nr:MULTISPECIES: SURF1 family protein [unclassified Pseudoalteromonas]TMN80945.1 SURF1 family protein [Pseudoalteromonas sp. S410]TMN87764.1 SURF1 family protein [Pseudoalteromonas sp. S408]TMN94810.1 SURF1 family protein [Pseudoalteromonas sp. S407]TMO02489.1 SURF1 family protein [Pseudoalteromonas sp. S409]TMO08772.1 SURF1 family protein [Pseudoalteromonas sp. S186]